MQCTSIISYVKRDFRIVCMYNVSAVARKVQTVFAIVCHAVMPYRGACNPDELLGVYKFCIISTKRQMGTVAAVS